MHDVLGVLVRRIRAVLHIRPEAAIGRPDRGSARLDRAPRPEGGARAERARRVPAGRGKRRGADAKHGDGGDREHSANTPGGAPA